MAITGAWGRTPRDDRRGFEEVRPAKYPSFLRPGEATALRFAKLTPSSSQGRSVSYTVDVYSNFNDLISDTPLEENVTVLQPSSQYTFFRHEVVAVRKIGTDYFIFKLTLTDLRDRVPSGGLFVQLTSSYLQTDGLITSNVLHNVGISYEQAIEVLDTDLLATVFAFHTRQVYRAFNYLLVDGVCPFRISDIANGSPSEVVISTIVSGSYGSASGFFNSIRASCWPDGPTLSGNFSASVTLTGSSSGSVSDSDGGSFNIVGTGSFSQGTPNSGTVNGGTPVSALANCSASLSGSVQSLNVDSTHPALGCYVVDLDRLFLLGLAAGSASAGAAGSDTVIGIGSQVQSTLQLVNETGASFSGSDSDSGSLVQPGYTINASSSVSMDLTLPVPLQV